MNEQEILNKLRDIDNSLSPEWLTCDGELSTSETRRRYNKSIKDWKTNIKLLGRNPTFKEIYGDLMPETIWHKEIIH